MQTPPLMTIFVHPLAEHSYLYFFLVTFILGRSSSNEDSRFVRLEAHLRCGLGNDSSPWLLTGVLFQLSSLWLDADDVFLLWAAAAAASAFLS
eukprot:scaffold18415_cov95-Skeletonema_marinoi.AAC.1